MRCPCGWKCISVNCSGAFIVCINTCSVDMKIKGTASVHNIILRDKDIELFSVLFNHRRPRLMIENTSKIPTKWWNRPQKPGKVSILSLIFYSKEVTFCFVVIFIPHYFKLHTIPFRKKTGKIYCCLTNTLARMESVRTFNVGLRMRMYNTYAAYFSIPWCTLVR